MRESESLLFSCNEESLEGQEIEDTDEVYQLGQRNLQDSVGLGRGSGRQQSLTMNLWEHRIQQNQVMVDSDPWQLGEESNVKILNNYE